MPFSINDLRRSVRQVVQPIAEEKGLVLRCGGPSSDRRLGRAAILHRVLLNLSTNARTCTDNGTITVTAVAAGPTCVCFQVDDTGHGMPPEVVATLSGPDWGGCQAP